MKKVQQKSFPRRRARPFAFKKIFIFTLKIAPCLPFKRANPGKFESKTKN
jgi:hypothetical protein